VVLGILQREPALYRRRRVITKQLLDRSTDEARIGDQLGTLLRVSGQRQTCPAEQSRHRLVTRDVDHRDEHQQLAVIEATGFPAWLDQI
jgi:hypothetical protein